MKTLFVAMLSLIAAAAQADTIQQVTKEIKQGSVLTLRNDVAQDLAENLLAAQQPGVCSYCASEPDSLQLSINAVLKAITLEKSFGVRYCDDNDCAIVWSQSTIAIDDNAGLTLTPRALYFGEQPVASPEPSIWILLIGGLIAMVIAKPSETQGRDSFVHLQPKNQQHRNHRHAQQAWRSTK